MLLWLVAAVGIVLSVVYGPGFREPALQGGLGLALGGATGNLVDRLRRGAVIDFIDLGWWPVFNVTDVGIVAGLLVAAWGLV